MTVICPITKLERVLLSTDGSEYSEGAVRESVRLARQYSSRLIAMSVVETNPELETIAPQVVEKSEEKVRSILEAVSAAASAEGVSCETIARRSEEPFQPIIDEAAKRAVDLIIMGRKGRTGLTRLLMGSVTAKVIGHSPCSVLVVPKSAKLDFKKIVVATDGSRFSAAASSEAIGIAKRCDAALVIISVVSSESASPFDIVHSEMQRNLIARQELEQAERYVNELAETATKEGVRTERIIAHGRPSEAIVDTARRKLADIIVVGSHGRTGMERLLMGSVTERVVGQADCAVLVVKPGQPG